MNPVLHHREKPELINICNFIFRWAVGLHQDILVVGEILDVENPLLRYFAPVEPVSEFDIGLEIWVEFLTVCF